MLAYWLFLAIIPVIRIRAQNCQDFTYDDCKLDVSQVVQIVTGVSEENCQAFCNVLYEENCSIFHYERQSQICRISAQPLASFRKSCTKIGGPKRPDLGECGKKGECDQILESACSFHDEMFENYEQINDTQICQLACGLLSDCEYFIHDKIVSNCQVKLSSSRQCDIIFGPKIPPDDSCFMSPETTEKTTTYYKLNSATIRKFSIGVLLITGVIVSITR